MTCESIREFMKMLHNDQSLPKTSLHSLAVIVMSRSLVVPLVIALLAGCTGASVNVKKDVVMDVGSCRPGSADSTEIAKSQMACHQGVAGDGVQVLLSSTTMRLSVHSDTTERELTSIFIRPADAVRESGPVRFDAFHSQGLVDLTGKTGCVGVLENGSAYIEKSGKSAVLNYSLRFRLVSPLGWLEDCREPHRMSGKVEL